ncbi:MAG: nucleotidyltransferase family protein [Vicinamibacterales bacterium]
MITAVVLAAGASLRMGRPKAALPLGPAGRTVLSYSVDTLLAAGLPAVTVVAGAHADAVRAAWPSRDRRVRIIEHPGWAQGQLSSLVAGLDAVDDPLLEALLVTLVDVPLVSAATVRAVVAAWRKTRAPIVRPVDGNLHGHPVIFDRLVFEELRTADPAVGAKAVFAAHLTEILDVTVSDPGAFEDLDTPDDYERLRQRHTG